MDKMNMMTNNNVAGNRTNPLNQPNQFKESPALAKKAKASAEDFNAELSQAGAAQAAQAILLAQAQQPKPEVKQAMLAPESAERSPATQQTAASLNAGAAIAGLKPWDSGWVTQGMGLDKKGLSNEMQPLFGQAEPASAQAPALPMGQTLSGAQSMPNLPTSSDSKVSDEAIQKALQSLATTRGEAAEAMSQLQQAAKGTDLSNLDKLAAQTDRNSQALTGAANPLQAALGNGVETSFIAAEGLRNGNGNGNENGSGLAAGGGYPALSGAEYLTTLSAVRGGHAQGSQTETGSGGQGTGGDSGQAKGSKLSSGLSQGLSKDGLKGKKLQFGDAMQATLNNGVGFHGAGAPGNMNGTGSVAKTEMTGHVVKGAMSQERLSSESLIGISDNIRALSAQGAGEIRVRLRPDNLGELSVRVLTQGNQVGLQIQASDENAKRILEQSMNHLKESLATQNLNLAQVDVTVAAGQMSSGLGGGFNQDSSQNQSSSQQQSMNHGNNQGWNQAANQFGNQGWNQGGNGQMSGSGDTGRGMNRATAASAAGALRSGAASARTVQSDGRLDLKA